MVSRRCVMVVKDALEKLGLPDCEVNLGEITLKEDISEEMRSEIGHVLFAAGLELVEDKKIILVQQIKRLILQLIYDSNEPLVQNLSAYLSMKLLYDYTYMSNLFSSHFGITIEKFYIWHKIERVKQLITYEDLSLTDIALKMHYSSVAHLSAQFKKITGVTPTHFKQGSGNKSDFIENR